MLTLYLEMKGSRRAGTAPHCAGRFEIPHPRSDAGTIASPQRRLRVDADHDEGKKTGIFRLRSA
jgi:hypothetical protein